MLYKKKKKTSSVILVQKNLLNVKWFVIATINISFFIFKKIVKEKL